jgi:glycosyltransferase involved in cell wall biosynthesis
MEALHIHKSAFIDHRIFRPLLSGPKKYNAVHVANVRQWKRHRLAWGVPRVAVVTYDYGEGGDQYQELAGYRDLAYGNFTRSEGQVRLDGVDHSAFARLSRMSLSPEEVREVICNSACGLILSAVEGCNSASAEYLLCGIPVVTTPSLGGRSELYDPRHVAIVNPTPAEVEAAVQRFNELQIDPTEVRESVMSKLREHRRRFIAWLCCISNKDLFGQADQDFWIPQFTNKLLGRSEVDPFYDHGLTFLHRADNLRRATLQLANTNLFNFSFSLILLHVVTYVVTSYSC